MGFLGIASFLISLKNLYEELETQRMKLDTYRCPKDAVRDMAGQFLQAQFTADGC